MTNIKKNIISWSAWQALMFWFLNLWLRSCEKDIYLFFLVRTAFNFWKLYLQHSVEYDARLASHGILERERERDVWNLLFHLFGWTELMRIYLIFFETIILEYVNGLMMWYNLIILFFGTILFHFFVFALWTSYVCHILRSCFNGAIPLIN